MTSDGEAFYPYGIPGSVHSNSAFVSVLPLQAAWSPDSQYLFTVQLDQRQVKTVGAVGHVPLDGSLRPETSHRKLALPGDAHAEVYRLVVIHVETGQIQEAKYGSVPVSNGAEGGFFQNTFAW